jgi:hypothetical protein
MYTRDRWARRQAGTLAPAPHATVTRVFSFGAWFDLVR